MDERTQAWKRQQLRQLAARTEPLMTDTPQPTPIDPGDLSAEAIAAQLTAAEAERHAKIHDTHAMVEAIKRHLMPEE